MDATPQALSFLRSIDASLKTLVSQGRTVAGGPALDIADDRDLDGSYGNPVVKFNPRDWRGDSCKGLTMAECPAEFLDLLASTFEYFAKQAEKNNEVTNTGKPVAPYKRKDAARARGWAARKRNGWKPEALAEADPTPFGTVFEDSSAFDVSGFEDVGADEIPF